MPYPDTVTFKNWPVTTPSMSEMFFVLPPPSLSSLHVLVIRATVVNKGWSNSTLPLPHDHRPVRAVNGWKDGPLRLESHTWIKRNRWPFWQNGKTDRSGFVEAVNRLIEEKSEFFNWSKLISCSLSWHKQTSVSIRKQSFKFKFIAGLNLVGFTIYYFIKNYKL